MATGVVMTLALCEVRFDTEPEWTGQHCRVKRREGAVDVRGWAELDRTERQLRPSRGGLCVGANARVQHEHRIGAHHDPIRNRDRFDEQPAPLAVEPRAKAAQPSDVARGRAGRETKPFPVRSPAK
jgi:hypothetical protein